MDLFVLVAQDSQYTNAVWLLVTGIIALASVIGTIAGVLWRTALWTRDNVVAPTLKSHLELIDTLKRELPAQSHEIKKQTSVLEQSGVTLKTIEEKLDKHHEWAASAVEKIKPG